MSPRRRAAIRWALAIALVVVVLPSVDIAAVASRLGSVDLRLAIPGIVGLVAVHLIGALTWRRLHRLLARSRLAWPSAIRLYYAAQAVGSITPANVGADVYRVAIVDEPGGRGSSILPIVIQRMTSMAALVALGALGAVALPAFGGAALGASAGAAPDPWIWILVAGLIATIATVAAWARWGDRVRARILASDLSGDGSAVDVKAWPAASRDGFALGLTFHAASLALGLLLVLAVDVTLAGRAFEVLAALAVARLSLALPITPSGIGIQEGALAFLFVQLGIPADVALAAILLVKW